MRGGVIQQDCRNDERRKTADQKASKEVQEDARTSMRGEKNGPFNESRRTIPSLTEDTETFAGESESERRH